MEKTFKTAIIIEGFRLNLDPNPTHRKSPILILLLPDPNKIPRFQRIQNSAAIPINQ